MPRTLRVKGCSFTTNDTDEQAAHRLAKYVEDRQVQSDFADSLLRQFRQRGQLSARQWPYVHLFVHRAASGESIIERKSEGIPVDAPMEDWVEVLDDVANVKFRTDVGPVAFSIAGPKARCPGSINVSDGQGFRDGAWYGRIQDKAGIMVFEPTEDCPEEVRRFVQMFGAGPAAVAYSVPRV